MAELADALDLGSSGNPRAGSSPVTRTIDKGSKFGFIAGFVSLFLLPDFIFYPLVYPLHYKIYGLFNDNKYKKLCPPCLK